MQGYMRIRNAGEMKGDRESVTREIVGDLFGIAAMVDSMATAIGEGSTPDGAALNLLGQQIYAAASALDEMEG